MLFSVTSIPAWAWGVALTIIGSLALVVAWFVRRHFEGFNKDLGGVSGTLYGRVGTNNQHIPGLVESVQEIANRIDLLKKASNEAHSKYDIHLSELNNGMSFSKSSSQEIKSISGRLTEWEKEMAASMTVLQKRVNEQDRRIEKSGRPSRGQGAGGRHKTGAYPGENAQRFPRVSAGGYQVFGQTRWQTGYPDRRLLIKRVPPPNSLETYLWSRSQIPRVLPPDR